MKALLMFWSIDIVLNNKMITNPTKIVRSFLEKETKMKFISFFEGNLKLRIEHFQREKQKD
jgi:hypothetical protein